MKHLIKKSAYAKHLFFTILITLLLCGCNSQTPTSQQRFDSFLNACFKEYVSENSVTLHFKLSNPASYGLSNQLPAAYGDFSYEYQKANCQRSKTLLKQLDKFDYSQLSKEQQLTWKIFRNKLEQSAASEDYILYQSLLGANGLPSQIPVTLSEYYFHDENDVKTYLSLMNQIPELFKQLLSFEDQRRKADIICPDYVINNTINQIDQFLSNAREDNLLTETFREKIQNVSELSADQKTTYIHNNQALFEQIILPAYQSLRTSLKAYIGSGTPKERVCQYKNGKNYYRLLIASNIGTDRTPEEYIAALEKQLKESASNIASLTKNNPNLYSSYLSAQPSLSDANEIFDELKTYALLDFPELSDVKCTLKEVPDSLSGTSSCAFYLVPPIDSTDSNIIYINNNRVDNREIFSTMAHEGYPGHLYQTNYYQKEKNPHPIRHLLRSEGYDEGWGTYAQLYSYQYLTFKNTDKETAKALRQLYRDNDILSLSLSALSDLYVNYKDYDQKALTEYLKPYGVKEENVSAIYQYVTENPASYLSYCLGYYELMDIQNSMKEQLGENFDIKEFHQLILDSGSCPFSILREQVNQFVKKS